MLRVGSEPTSFFRRARTLAATAGLALAIGTGGCGSLHEQERIEAAKQQQLRSSLNVASVSAEAGQFEAAARLYFELTRHFPDAPEPRLGLGYLALRNGNFSRAATLFGEAEERSTTPVAKAEALLGAGRASLGEGNLAQAKRLFLAASGPAKDTPVEAWAANGLGVVATLEGNHARARLHYDNALKLSPSHPMITANLIRALVRTGDKDEAQRLYDKHASSHWLEDDGTELAQLLQDTPATEEAAAGAVAAVAEQEAAGTAGTGAVAEQGAEGMAGTETVAEQMTGTGTVEEQGMPESRRIVESSIAADDAPSVASAPEEAPIPKETASVAASDTGTTLASAEPSAQAMEGSQEAAATVAEAAATVAETAATAAEEAATAAKTAATAAEEAATGAEEMATAAEEAATGAEAAATGAAPPAEASAPVAGSQPATASDAQEESDGPATPEPATSELAKAEPATPEPATETAATTGSPAAGSPAASPPAAEAAAGPGAHVQLYAARSEAEALAVWGRLTKQETELLGSLTHRIVRADLPAKGVYYRLRVGPLEDRTAAKRLCGLLKGRGRDCFVAAEDWPAAGSAAAGILVQLHASSSRNGAMAAWRRLFNAEQDLLDALTPRVVMVQSPKKDVFYRLFTGPFPDVTAARSLCVALKDRGRGCLVRAQ